jgi:outer membrane protein TolC
MRKPAHFVHTCLRFIFAMLLLQAGSVFAAELQPSVAAPPDAPQAQPAQSKPAGLSFTQASRRFFNPFAAFHAETVPPPPMANSIRLGALVRDGKLYLSLRDAIDQALENNLDIVISRYNLPIAQTDIQRTAAGGTFRGVNAGVVMGTPGGGGDNGAAGTGVGGTTTGAGGAGAGSSGIVSSTLGAGAAVNGYDPVVTATAYVDHTTELPTTLLGGGSLYKYNTVHGTAGYTQNFPIGANLQMNWVNERKTTNGVFDFLSPSLTSRLETTVTQQLLAGFGPGPNLRFLRIARNNENISDIAFRAQVIATVTQICNIYWDLVNAYDEEQVRERSVDFASETLKISRKQLELEATPEMDVVRAESDLATRQQDLTIARTNLELQELYMKNAITGVLDNPVMEEMAVVPTDRIATKIEPLTEPVQDMIAEALKDRPELQESKLDMENRALTRKSARNALLPSLSLYGSYAGSGLAGSANPSFASLNLGNGVTINPPSVPANFTGALQGIFKNTAPEYRVGMDLQIPIRNRIAKADQYRTELEYRQAQVYAEQLKKRIHIEVRNACYALEQGAGRVDAARNARDLAAKTLDIMQKEQKLGAGSNQMTLAAEHDLALASSALVTAETAYEKARIEVLRSTGSVLEKYGISIADAKSGLVEDSY